MRFCASMAWAALLGGLVCGCVMGDGLEGETFAEGAEAAAPSTGVVLGAEAWDYVNTPSHLQAALEYTLSALPKEGRATHIPWPDTYWPIYEDSINARWQVIYFGKAASKDTLSPAEKYDLAFNSWKPADDFYKLKPYQSSNCASKTWDNSYYDKLGPAAKWTAQYKGNWEAHDGTDSDGDGKADECDDRDGIETWWGLCHAWVPAAILEKEPLKPVEHNGVKFEVSDIKALIVMMYDKGKATLVGGRCNDKEVKRDEKTGRVLADQCRDVNPGTYHVAMANFLGKMKRSLAEDRTYNYEVWNQPIVEWKVTQMKKVTKTSAIKILGLPSSVKKYPYNSAAYTLYDVYATTYYITESEPGMKPLTDVIAEFTREDNYRYILEVDKQGKVIGGEWVGSSQVDHPDFLWNPTGAGGSNPHITMANVKMLLEKSVSTGQEVPPENVKVFESTTAVSIPDNSPTGAKSTITVPDDLTIAAKIEVDVHIQHSYVGDLKVTLEKGGKTVVLHDNEGGGATDIKKTYTVSDFNGTSMKGTWTLTMVDNAAQDTGKLVSWKLKLPAAGGGPAGGVLKASATDVPKDIPDNDTNGITSTINIADSKTVKSVKVAVKIEHSYIGALVVELQHEGKTATLHNKEGSEGTIIEKTFEPTELNGTTSAGPWKLKVADTDAYGDLGKLVSWSLEIAY